MRDLSSLDFNKKRIVIFDMDGTLIDSIGIWNLTDQKTIRHFGGPVVNLDEIQIDRENYLNTHTNSDIYLSYVGYLKEKYSLNTNTDQEILNYRWQVSSEVLQKDAELKPGALDFISILKKYEYIIVLATMTTRVQLDAYDMNQNISRICKFTNLFDLVISKEDVHRKKPDPEIFNLVLERLKVIPEECLIIEDSLAGVISAKNAHIDVITIYDKYSEKDRTKILQLTDYYVESFHDLLNIIIKNNQNNKYGGFENVS